MTVKELISELGKYPPETIVAIDNGEAVVNIDEVELYSGWWDKVVLK